MVLEKEEGNKAFDTFKKHHSFMKDDQNRYRVGSLFWELRKPQLEEKFPPIFTTKDSAYTVPSPDKKSLITYPSLKEIYFSYDHVPTCEYEFAMDVLGSWEHWKCLVASATLKETIASWREELSVRIKCNAIKKLMSVSSEPTAVGVNAARYLADEGYVPKRVGRITKEDKLREVRIAAGVRDDLSSDMERIGMVVVK